MGSGASKSAAAERMQRLKAFGKKGKKGELEIGVDYHKYLVAGPETQVLKVILPRRKGQPCPTAANIKYEIGNTAAVPVGCMVLRKVIIDWEKEMLDDMCVEGDAPTRTMPGIRYKLVDEKDHKKLAKLKQKKSYTIKQLNADWTQAQIEQYIWFYMNSPPMMTNLDKQLQSESILNDCYEGGLMKVAHAVIGNRKLLGDRCVNFVCPAGAARGQNMFARACVRDPDLAMKMLDGKMISRTVLNALDEFHQGPLHFAARRGAWDLCARIVHHPQIERWTLQGEHMVTKQTPCDVAFDADQTPTHFQYKRFRDLVGLKVDKIANVQVEKKAKMSKGSKSTTSPKVAPAPEPSSPPPSPTSPTAKPVPDEEKADNSAGGRTPSTQEPPADDDPPTIDAFFEQAAVFSDATPLDSDIG